MFPELADHALRELDPSEQPGKAMQMRERLRQPCRELQILALLRDELARQAFHFRPVGRLQLDFPLVLWQILVRTPRLLDLVELVGKREVRPPGVSAVDG